MVLDVERCDMRVTWMSLWVFVLERIDRERRDLVDFEGLAGGGGLTVWRILRV